MKEKLFSVTKKDLIFEYFSGTGKGGQHRNKHQNCCRCKHPESGAIGTCQEYRSKDKNTRVAFKRMTETKEFIEWIRLEASRQTGLLEEIKNRVEKEMKQNIRIEVKNDSGRWTAYEEDNDAGRDSKTCS